MLDPKKSTSIHDAPVCDSPNTAVFDLGAGKAVDVRRISPEFFSMRAEGWTHPRQTFASAERQSKERNRMLRQNKNKIEALRRGTVKNAFTIDPVIVDDIDVANVVPAAESSPTRIHAWAFGQDTIIFRVVAGECPHVFSTNSCQEGELVSQPHVEGSVPCLGDISISQNDIWIQIEGERPTATKLGDLAAIRFLPTTPERRNFQNELTLRVALRLPNDPTAAWNGDVVVNDHTGVEPDDVLALALSGRLDHLVAVSYANLHDDDITPEFNAKLTELRVNAAKAFAVKAVQDPTTFARHLGMLSYGTDVPGSREIGEALSQQIRQVLSKLTSQGDFDALVTGASIVKAMRTLGIHHILEVDKFENHFGASIVDGTTRNRQAIQVFAETFPESRYVARFHEREQQEATSAKENRVEKRRNSEINERWFQLYTSADEIASLRHNRRWLLKNYGYDPRNKGAAVRMKNHEGVLIRERFCAARKGFLEVSTQADLKTRAAEHCEREPPTGHALDEEVPLPTECRKVFRISCR